MVFLANEKSIFEFFTQPKFSLSSELPFASGPTTEPENSFSSIISEDFPSQRMALQHHASKIDGTLRQFSLTPHPSILPQKFLDQKRAESAALFKRSHKSKIIRFVGIELRLPDGTPHSLTPK